MLLATDSLKNKPLAGALVTGENEEESIFFFHALKKWLPKPLKLITIDFSKRIESGVKAIFPDIPIQKCVFHSIQLLSRGFIKEFTRIKDEQLLPQIKEWNQIRRISINVEREKKRAPTLNLVFKEPQKAWKIYEKLRRILIKSDYREIEAGLDKIFTCIEFKRWKGKEAFLEKYRLIFTKRKFIFSEKSQKYIVDKTQKAWRAAIRKQRTALEESKTHFNKIKFLILMNPLNMKTYHKKKLRKYLKEFPWLRSYRKIMTTFYRQFDLPPEKRRSLNFLTQLQTGNCHPRLNSAINTLLEYEEHVFRYQSIHIPAQKLKNKRSIKVVNESSNKIVNQLYRTQCGMRTLENMRMRITHRLKCPIIISPSLIEKSK